MLACVGMTFINVVRKTSLGAGALCGSGARPCLRGRIRGRHFLIGLSHRTNEEGARQLAEILAGETPAPPIGEPG